MTCCPSCVTFERSLQILNLDNPDGAYGFVEAESQCGISWSIRQREGWQRYLCAALSEIQRDIKRAICPQQIYDEVKFVGQQIVTNQKPIDQLGKPVYSDWNDISLTDDPDNGRKYFDLCQSELAAIDPDATSDDLEFSWDATTLECYMGDSCFQEPCIVAIDDCGLAEPGWRIYWPYRQLVPPDVEIASVEADLLTDVRWRVKTIDSSLAVEAVGQCGCYVCQGSVPTFTASIVDAKEGVICLDRTSGCVNMDTRVRLNYTTTGEIDPTLEEAVVLLALVYSQNTNVKPCGCDNTKIEALLKPDPTAGSDFATKLRYGATVAGMTVLRIVNKYLETPNFNSSNVPMNGGLLSSRKPFSKTAKRIHYLRRFE